MYHILVVEDDHIQRKALTKVLSQIKCNSDINIIEVDSISSALDVLSKNFIDLLFVDIELEDGSGLDLVKNMRKDKEYEFIPIVFVTAHHNYILPAFKITHCYEYITKPYEEKEIKEIAIKLLNSPMIKNKGEKFLKFYIHGIYIKILLEDIFFVESFNKDCVIHTKQGEYRIKRFSLKKILRTVKEPDLIQCHRSYIVNENLIRSVNTRNRTWIINFQNYNEVAYVGITYQDFIKNKLM